MTQYQRRVIRTGRALGAAGPLPADVPDGLTAEDLLSIGQRLPQYRGQAFVEVSEPEPPAPVRVIPRRDFMRRFERGELVAIEADAADDPQIRVFLRLLDAGDTVDLDAEDTVQGLAYLELEGLLEDGRAAAIRA